MKEIKRISQLDGIRGIAIIGVISAHVAQNFLADGGYFLNFFSLGRYGVQLFFLVSGFTMCYIWVYRRSETFAVAKFYTRRIFRILPLFYFFLIIKILIIYFEYGVFELAKLKTNIFVTFFFLNSIIPNYIYSFFNGSWAISVEIIFYFLFPLIIFCLKDKPSYYLILAYLIFLFNNFIIQLNIESFFQPHSINNLLKDFLHLNFFNQLPIFLLGCFIFFRKGFSSLDSCIFLLWFFSLIFIPDTMEARRSKIFFWLICLFLFLISYFFLKFDHNIKNKFLENIGKNSYSIYLSHVIFIDFAVRFISKTNNIFLITISIFFLVIFCNFFSNIFLNTILRKINKIKNNIINLL